MRILLDTNVLLRLADASAAEHTVIRSAMIALAGQSLESVATAQVLVEFWAVATRPQSANGLGWDEATTTRALNALTARFPLLVEGPGIYGRWLALVQTGVRGKRAHDARIAAVMLENSVTHILTLNEGDFAGFPAIAPVRPEAVVAGALDSLRGSS